MVKNSKKYKDLIFLLPLIAILWVSMFSYFNKEQKNIHEGKMIEFKSQLTESFSHKMNTDIYDNINLLKDMANRDGKIYIVKNQKEIFNPILQEKDVSTTVTDVFCSARKKDPSSNKKRIVVIIYFQYDGKTKENVLPPNNCKYEVEVDKDFKIKKIDFIS